MRGGQPITVELTLEIRRELHASSPFHDTTKVAQNRAPINGFLNPSMLFIVPLQYVSSRQR